MKFLKTFMLILAIGILVISCKKDDPDGIVVDASNFAGNYVTAETCDNNSNGSNSIIITKVTSSTITLGFVNTLGTGTKTINASVTGNSISISNQTVNLNPDVITINGSGTLSGKVLTMMLTYKYSTLPLPIKCTLVCTKP